LISIFPDISLTKNDIKFEIEIQMVIHLIVERHLDVSF